MDLLGEPVGRTAGPSGGLVRRDAGEHFDLGADPNKGEHLVRYYGWYSHRQRGIRAKASAESNSESINIDRTAPDAQKPAGSGPRPGSVSTWAT